MKQREVFLEGEGDAWLARNQAALAARSLPADDPLLTEILLLPLVGAAHPVRLLEIGCGDGARLEWLHHHRGFACSGLDPSRLAVTRAAARGVDARHGTADRLPFADNAFDIVVFGFCLYLCDRDELFRIAAEADRVLSPPGWLVIHDFHSPVPRARTYHHVAGLMSYKMDFSRLFSWHPDYSIVAQKIIDEGGGRPTEDEERWLATSVLRKRGAGGARE